jgi:hypothetical protein
VVELGSALRDARERSGLALADAERETRIRARYLDALERERFERVPERAYARAFLLEYAVLLGLEPGPLVDEFDRRFPPEPAPRLVVVEPPRRPLVLVGVVAVAILALAIGMLARAHPPLPRPLVLTPPREPRSTAHTVVHKVAPRPQEPSVGLVLVAHGPCWVEAHAGGTRLGQRVLYRTLRPGERIRLNGARFWLRLGAPQNLEARVGGRLVRLPLKTANVVVATRAS